MASLDFACTLCTSSANSKPTATLDVESVCVFVSTQSTQSILFRLLDSLQGESPGTYELLAGATLVEGVYVARTLEPQNEYVLDAERNGIPAAIIVRKETPGEVQSWLTHNHNYFNSVQGSITSYIELMAKIPEIEGSWKDTRRKPKPNLLQ